MSLWITNDAPSVMICHVKDDNQKITMIDTMHWDFLIWSIIIIYEQNDNETLCIRENIDHHYGPYLMVSILWVVGIDHICSNESIMFLILLLKSNIYGLVVDTALLIFRYECVYCFFSLQSKIVLIVGYINYAEFHVFGYKASLFANNVIFSSYLLLFCCL